MSRKFPKPFFRRDRGHNRGWFVQLGKRQVKLTDGSESVDTEAVAFKLYDQLMTGRGNEESSSPLVSTDSPLVAMVLDQ